MSKPRSSPHGDEQFIHARCPSCGEVGDFRYIGLQEWPKEVATRLDYPSQTRLYLCMNCGTTISEPMLQDPDD